MGDNLHSIITNLLIDCGAPKGVKGFGYVVEMVVDGVYNDRRIKSRCELCENWGTTFGDTPTKIERGLFYVKATCFENKTETFRNCRICNGTFFGACNVSKHPGARGLHWSFSAEKRIR